MKINTRKIRQRKKIKKTANRPRIVIFRSNRYLYAQIIDSNGKVLVTANSLQLKKTKKKKTLSSKFEEAVMLGKLLAQKALKAKVDKVVFDKSGYKYHGKIRALADAARNTGLKF